MRNAKQVLLPLLAALLTGGTLAAPAAAVQAAPSRTQAQPGAGTGLRAPQAVQVAYYRGDPLNGGQLLGTRTVTPGPGERPFQNAPSGATYAVVTTPLGKRVVNLRDAQSQPGPGNNAQRPGPDQGGGGPNGAPPQGQPGTSGSADANGTARPPAPRGDFGPLGGALRGATRVTFYTADPLQGGRATGTITLSGTSQNMALTQAARGAKFAVVERPGERLIVDLSATPGQPGRAAPQGTQQP